MIQAELGYCKPFRRKITPYKYTPSKLFLFVCLGFYSLNSLVKKSWFPTVTNHNVGEGLRGYFGKPIFWDVFISKANFIHKTKIIFIVCFIFLSIKKWKCIEDKGPICSFAMSYIHKLITTRHMQGNLLIPYIRWKP